MACHKFRMVAAAALGLVFSLAALAAQEAHWQELMQAAGRLAQEKNYKGAEKQYKAALREAEAFGKQDPRLATTLQELAALYESQRNFDQAEPLYQRALTISESLLGPNDPKLIESVSKLAEIEWILGRADKAEILCQRAVEMTERVRGPDHLELAEALDRLAIYEYIDGLYVEGRFDPQMGMELALASRLGPLGTIVSVRSFGGVPEPQSFDATMPSSALDSFSELKRKQIKKLIQSASRIERALAI